MKFSTGVFFAVVSSAISSASAKCGQWNTNACSGDRRYDDAVSAKLKQNGDAWKYFQGLWVGKQFASGRKDAPSSPEFVSERTPNAIPYKRDEVTMLVNNTVVGTRFIQHTHLIYERPGDEFCGIPLTEGSLNYLGAVKKCGESGYAVYGSHFATANYEKDGVAETVYSAGAYESTTSATFTPVSDKTIFFSGRSETGLSTVNYVFTDEDNRTIHGTGNNFVLTPRSQYDTSPLDTVFRIELEKVSESRFKDALENAKSVAMVPDEFSVNTNLPMTGTGGNCIEASKCYSESDMAAVDPATSESPYQEDSTVNGGLVAGLVIAGFIVVVCILCYVHFKRVNAQKSRYQHQFARRVAETINVEGTHEKLTAEALQGEFNRIDQDGNGSIDKEEMWEFMSSGKVGKMSERDFNALFAAMDTDHSGSIEFAEFAAFLSHCGAVYDEEQRFASE